MARSGCIYGPTGSFKTTAIAHFSHWVAETTGKATLLLSADGGGWDAASEEVMAGMIRPHRLDPELVPLAVIRKFSQGYWPKHAGEPLSATNPFTAVNWDEIGGYAVEGITSMGLMLMRHCADKNLRTGEEGVTPVRQHVMVDDQTDTETFTQNSRGHYGFVQNQLYSIVMNFISLPVSYCLFTAHEKRYTEDGELQVGISSPGKAITPLIPTWIGDCIHAQDYKVQETITVKNEKGELVPEQVVSIRCRYYYKKHLDPATGAVFDAKPRVTHSKATELERVFPGGFFVPTPDGGFDNYLRAVDALAKDAAESDKLKEWRRQMDVRLGRAGKAQVAL